MAIKVDVQFDKPFFEFYKTLKETDNPSFPPLIPNSEISSKTEEMENKIKDKNVKKHISVLYSSLYKYCNNLLNSTNMCKAVNEFEKYLRENTGKAYEINLIFDGNL